MICTNCNSEINDNSNFCPVCGFKYIEETAMTVKKDEFDVEEERVKACATKTMIFGIISIAMAMSNGIVGIVFGILAGKQNRIYESMTKKHSSKAMVGSILGKAGLWLSIGYSVLFAIAYILFIVIYIVFISAVTSTIHHAI